jgi:predicted DsbA family dithiol-disulfide isomerase
VSSAEDNLRFVFTSKAGQVLPPIAQDLVDALELEGDPAHVEAVGRALARAFMEGTAVGATEMVAQAAERGILINLNWLGDPG